jgi:glycosyltransferase involved in cell wall biosynthesis
MNQPMSPCDPADKGVASMPFISLIVPVFNIKQYLPDCIRSIMDQPFDSWEIILVDDKSSDGSESLCDRYAAADSRITAVHLPENSGPGVARNQGLLHATGDYVFFMDGDDTIVSNTLPGLCREISACCFPDMMHVQYSESFGFSQQSPIDATHSEGLPCSVAVDSFLTHFLNASKFGFFIWEFAFRRSKLVEWGCSFRAAYLAEDIDFVIRCLCFADTVGTYAPVFYRWRTRLCGSLTSAHNMFWHQLLESAAVMLELLSNTGISGTRREWILQNIHFAIIQFEAVAGSVPPEEVYEHGEAFRVLESNTRYLNRFLTREGLLDYISTSGAVNGAAAFCRKQAEKALELIGAGTYRTTFVFPATRKNSRLMAVLGANNLKFKGMLDNDPMKQGLMLDGHTIYKPDIIPLCYGDADNVFIIVSTSTLRTNNILSDQLRSYGLQEGKDFVCTGYEAD